MFSVWKQALAFAIERHGDQQRKGTKREAVDLGAPYVTHPVAVSELCFIFFPGNHSLAVAALLHDLLEDTKTTPEEIRDMFGIEVHDLVVGVTKKGKNWHDTRDLTVEKIRTTENLDIVRLKACDALHNAVSIERDARYYGADFWSRFNVGPADIVGYYRRMVDAIAERLPDEPVTIELKMVLERIAGGTQADV